MIRSAAALPILEGMDQAPAGAGRPTRLGRRRPDSGRPIWIHMPIAEAARLSPMPDLPEYCEAVRCETRRPKATTFHALIGSAGKADYAWVACADCTGLMIEGA
jgi:hypothetical protein